jgi:thiol-disulfide isomerase/thioredoxin
MRKIFAIAMAAAMMVACGSSTKFTIKGESDKFAGQYAYLQVEEGQELKTIDSVAVAGNAFTLAGETEAPYAAYVVVKDAGAERPEFYAEVYVEPAQITIEEVAGERPSFKAVGGAMNDAMNAVNDKLAAIEAKMGEGDNSALEAEYYAALYDAIIANGGNLVAQNILRNNYYAFEPQQVIDAIATIPAEAQESFANMKKSAEQALKVLPGNPYIDITEEGTGEQPQTLTPDGKVLTLKSVVENKANKYVLIDFWASWCGPCMREVPYLVDTYKKYHNKGFEIYGVSFDRAREPWLKAIEEKELDWVHVSAVNYWDNKARHDYAVNSIPANFLVDCSTGKIIAKGLRGEQVAEKIGELLK